MGKMQDRHEHILDLLAAKPVCTVGELSEALLVTAETVRKDLDALEQAGRVTRIHGGAALSARQGGVVPYSTREQLHSREKERVACAAEALIAQGDTLLLEGSTTTAHLCQRLVENAEKLKTLTIFSNSAMVAQALQMGALCSRFFLLGGWLRQTEGAAYGAFTIAQLKGLRFDKAFLSGAALDCSLELTAYDEDDLIFQQTAMERAAQSVLMLDSGKYPIKALYRVCDAADFDLLVTDAPLDPEKVAELQQRQCRWIRA